MKSEIFMKIISGSSELHRKFISSRHTGRKNYVLSEEDYDDFDYIQAPPIYSGYMLYADVVNQYHLKKNHRGTIIQPQFLSIRYIVEGSQYVHCNGKIFLAEKGDLMLIPPLCDYSYATGPEGHCFQRSITMKGTLLNTILEHTGFSRDFCIHLDTPRFYLDVHTNLKEIHRQNAPDICERNSAICFFLLQRLANFCNTAYRPELLVQSQHFIEQHLADSLTLRSISTELKRSPSTLNKLFRKHLNVSIHQYIIFRRMDCALCMLRSRGYSIKEIACQTGFSSISNFSTEFRKFYGKSPKNFQKDG